MSLPLKQAAARSAARSKKKRSVPVPGPTTSSTADSDWEVKKTIRGTLYRVKVVSLRDLPKLLEEYDPKLFFHFLPEEDRRISDPEERYRSGFVLGVRKKGEEGEVEL